MRRAIAVCLAAGVSIACGSKDPTERVKRNVADREKIQAEGVELRQKGLCTLDAIAAARDPDRHFLACLGFATADGPNPALIAFREQHEGADDKAIFAACHDPAEKHTFAVGVVFCNPALERLRVVAEKERDAYRRDGRCTNKALRATADPDGDYFTCYGHQIYFEPFIRLAEFRKRFGPDLDTIQARCSQLGSEIGSAHRKSEQARISAMKSGGGPTPPPPELASFVSAYGVFCTEEPPRGEM